MIWAWPWTNFLRDLVEVRGSQQQLAQYVAVLTGVRRALDDWIPRQRLDDFKELMFKLGLKVRVDCVFSALDRSSQVLGAAVVPTTEAVALPFQDKMVSQAGSTVHLVVSSRSDWADEALAAAWYPVAVDNRILRKPLIDNLWLGRAFGYPDCCSDFFIRHNDWPRLNTLAEATNRSALIRWETNCLPKHTPWMAVFHMPCEWNCHATREYTEGVLAAVSQFDKGYATEIKRIMSQPYLVVSELQIYVLENAEILDVSRVKYGRASYMGANIRHDRFSAGLARGNELEVQDGIIHVWQDGHYVTAMETRCDLGVVEVPLVLNFE